MPKFFEPKDLFFGLKSFDPAGGPGLLFVSSRSILSDWVKLVVRLFLGFMS
jgi:hypothetical protein